MALGNILGGVATGFNTTYENLRDQDRKDRILKEQEAVRDAYIKTGRALAESGKTASNFNPLDFARPSADTPAFTGDDVTPGLPTEPNRIQDTAPAAPAVIAPATGGGLFSADAITAAGNGSGLPASSATPTPLIAPATAPTTGGLPSTPDTVAPATAAPPAGISVADVTATAPRTGAMHSTGVQSDQLYAQSQAMLQNARTPEQIEYGTKLQQAAHLQRTHEIARSINIGASQHGFDGIFDVLNSVDDGKTPKLTYVEQGPHRGMYEVEYGPGNKTWVRSPQELAVQITTAMSDNPELVAKTWNENRTTEADLNLKNATADYYRTHAGVIQAAEGRMEKTSQLEDALRAETQKDQKDWTDISNTSPLLNGDKHATIANSLYTKNPAAYTRMEPMMNPDGTPMLNPATMQPMQHAVNILEETIARRKQDDQAVLARNVQQVMGPNGKPATEKGPDSKERYVLRPLITIGTLQDGTQAFRAAGIDDRSFNTPQAAEVAMRNKARQARQAARTPQPGAGQGTRPGGIPTAGAPAATPDRWHASQYIQPNKPSVLDRVTYGGYGIGGGGGGVVIDGIPKNRASAELNGHRYPSEQAAREAIDAKETAHLKAVGFPAALIEEAASK